MDGQALNPTAATMLGFLLAGPASGYELDQRISRSTAHFWSITRSQLYRELRSLAAAGLVEVTATGPRDRQEHRITTAGRECFASWIAFDPGTTTLRDPLLLAVFFGDHVERTRLRRIVSDARRRSQDEIDDLSSMRDAASGAPFPAATLRYGLAHERVRLEWLDWLLDDADSPLQAGVRRRGSAAPSPSLARDQRRR